MKIVYKCPNNYKIIFVLILVMEELFRKVYLENYNELEYDVRASYLEIYNEKIRDLLFPEKNNIKIMQESRSGLMMSNATSVPITNLNEVLNVFE